MKEVTGNLWTYPADVRVITTNGTVKKNGECVMGRGCAFEAKEKFPDIAKRLGDQLKRIGNHVTFLNTNPAVLSFPVKHHWYQRADLDFIARSAGELKGIMGGYGRDTIIVLPRPGCGNGGLRWEDVKPVLEPILDDRFHVIAFK